MFKEVGSSSSPDQQMQMLSEDFNNIYMGNKEQACFSAPQNEKSLVLPSITCHVPHHG